MVLTIGSATQSAPRSHALHKLQAVNINKEVQLQDLKTRKAIDACVKYVYDKDKEEKEEKKRKARARRRQRSGGGGGTNGMVIDCSNQRMVGDFGAKLGMSTDVFCRSEESSSRRRRPRI